MSATSRASGSARIVARPYRDRDDWWGIRSLLIETLPLTPPGWNWDVRHWDGYRFHRDEPFGDDRFAAEVRLWETTDGHVIGAVHPDGHGAACLQGHPGHRDLEPEMIDWAEAHLAAMHDDGSRTLELTVRDDDGRRRDLLGRLGYVMTQDSGWQRHRRLPDSLPPGPPLVAGYRMRTTRATDEDCARIAELLNAAFGRTTHTRREYTTFIDGSPSFEHDLNLVAVAPDDSFAAHVGCTNLPTARHGIVEPVCTHPDHRRAGLARALILEGLHRLAARGTRTAFVETGDDAAANALYASCGFDDAQRVHSWRRSFAPA
jgi:mycothiol synthase